MLEEGPARKRKKKKKNETAVVLHSGTGSSRWELGAANFSEQEHSGKSCRVPVLSERGSGGQNIRDACAYSVAKPIYGDHGKLCMSHPMSTAMRPRYFCNPEVHQEWCGGFVGER